MNLAAKTKIKSINRLMQTYTKKQIAIQNKSSELELFQDEDDKRKRRIFAKIMSPSFTIVEILLVITLGLISKRLLLGILLDVSIRVLTYLYWYLTYSNEKYLKYLTNLKKEAIILKKQKNLIHLYIEENNI